MLIFVILLKINDIGMGSQIDNKRIHKNKQYTEHNIG